MLLIGEVNLAQGRDSSLRVNGKGRMEEDSNVFETGSKRRTELNMKSIRA